MLRGGAPLGGFWLLGAMQFVEIPRLKLVYPQNMKIDSRQQGMTQGTLPVYF